MARGRAENRHHSRRVKKNRLKLDKVKGNPNIRHRMSMCECPQSCSCWCCGNRRKYEGATRKERQDWNGEL